jgi:hypothetical protein
MHDYIFHHQHTLEDTDLTRFAGAVGLQMQQFTRALAVLYWGVPCAALEMADPSLVVAASGPGLHWEPSHVHLSSFLDDMSYFHAFVSGGAIYGDWTRLSRAFADFIGMACPTIPMKPISYF